jgi:CubicO group peptidase (beta-lactamase class C family)
MTAKLSRFRFVVTVVFLMLFWAALVIAAPLAGVGEMKADGPGGKAFIDATRAVSNEHPGNLALVLIENGKVTQSYAMSIGKPVSGDTLFQMASVSKWVAAWGVMTLVQAGKVDLDAPVSRYLKRWKLPPSDFSNDQVTVRRLLSHTAGLTDDLGYCGFAQGSALQSLEASLTKAADACPLRTGVVRVGEESGSWRYSGGGYTLLQLLIEEVSGEPFADYMQHAVLVPLGMTRSTYRVGALGSADIAEFFDVDGRPAPHYLYTAAAAASLYSTANDMARFAMAHMPSSAGEAPGRGIISPRMLADMRAPQAVFFGTAHWGMGPQLFATSKRGGFIYGHNGGNMPAVSHSVRIEAATGDAIVALSTGGRNLGTRLGSYWTAQRRDAITPAMIFGAALRLINPAEAPRAWGWLATGWVIILASSLLLWRRSALRRLRKHERVMP